MCFAFIYYYLFKNLFLFGHPKASHQNRLVLEMLKIEKKKTEFIKNKILARNT